MKRQLGILILLSFIISAVSAQKLKGSIDFLKGQKTVNVIFDYKGVTIDGSSEASYVKERVKEDGEAGKMLGTMIHKKIE